MNISDYMRTDYFSDLKDDVDWYKILVLLKADELEEVGKVLKRMYEASEEAAEDESEQIRLDNHADSLVEEMRIKEIETRPVKFETEKKEWDHE